jgi:hypothetical protein
MALCGPIDPSMGLTTGEAQDVGLGVVVDVMIGGGSGLILKMNSG